MKRALSADNYLYVSMLIDTAENKQVAAQEGWDVLLNDLVLAPEKLSGSAYAVVDEQKVKARVETLLKHKEYIDIDVHERKEGFTMLHAVASQGLVTATCILVAGGLSPVEKDNRGRTPSTVAQSEGFPLLAAIIASWEAQPMIQ